MFWLIVEEHHLIHFEVILAVLEWKSIDLYLKFLWIIYFEIAHFEQMSPPASGFKPASSLIEAHLCVFLKLIAFESNCVNLEIVVLLFLQLFNLITLSIIFNSSCY